MSKRKRPQFIPNLSHKNNPRLSRQHSIFKDLLLKTGGCLPKYLWASHYIMCELARRIQRLAPLNNLLVLKISLLRTTQGLFNCLYLLVIYILAYSNFSYNLLYHQKKLFIFVIYIISCYFI